MAAPIVSGYPRSDSPNPPIRETRIADDPTEVHQKFAFAKPSSNILMVAGKEVILDTWERLENLYGVALRNRVVQLGEVLKLVKLQMRPCPGHNEGKIEWILEAQKVLSNYAGQAPVLSEHVPSFQHEGKLSDAPGALSSLNGSFLGETPLHYGEPGIVDHNVEVLQPAWTEKKREDFTEPSSNILKIGGTRVVLDNWERLENLNAQALQDRFMELKRVLSSLGHQPGPCPSHHDAKIAWILDAQVTLHRLVGQPPAPSENKEVPFSVKRSLEGPGALASLYGQWGNGSFAAKEQQGVLHRQRGIVENTSEFRRPEVFTDPSERILEINGTKIMLDSFEHLEYLSRLQLQNRVIQLHDILRSVRMEARPCPGHQEDKIMWILETQQMLKEKFQHV